MCLMAGFIKAMNIFLSKVLLIFTNKLLFFILKNKMKQINYLRQPSIINYDDVVSINSNILRDPD